MPDSYPYIISNNKLGPVLAKIRSAAKPDRLSQKLLKNWGFTASNDRAIITVLKDLGFLNESGAPTEYYDLLRDPNEWAFILGQRVRDLYSDLYATDTNIHNATDNEIRGTISRVTGKDDKSVGRYLGTFKALAALSKFEPRPNRAERKAKTEEDGEDKVKTPPRGRTTDTPEQRDVDFHYNIQIHLPATTDISVYNAIFKSLRENLSL